MKKVLIIMMLTTWGMTLSAQEVGERKDSVKQENIFCDGFEVQASFHGGSVALQRYLEENVRWPDEESDVQGRVVVSFMVEKDGSLSEIKVVRGLHPAFDKEALRVVENMPKWYPAKLNGKGIRQKIILPIPFKLK